MKKILLLSLCCLMLATVQAQVADGYFDKKDYYNASLNYEKEALSNPALYLKLAKSYFSLRKFEQAKEAIKLYGEKAPSPDRTWIAQFTEMLDRMDDAVTISNVGNVVNTAKADYFPQISKDGKTLYFTSWERDGGLGGEDIWSSKRKDDGSWEKPVPFNQINTTSHEDIMSLSSDNNVAILFGNYNGTFGSGDLFYSVNTQSGWTTPCNLGGAVNGASWEAQATLGPDGRSMVFCSTRSGGQGNADLWYTKLTETGWTAPVNLGAALNTSLRDYSPMLAADGKTLYFSTNGRFSFGGSDLYMTKRLDDSWTNWSPPVNLGRYINSLEDDEYMTIPASGTKAYLVRQGAADGFGEADIYSFIIPPAMRPEAIFNVHGFVKNEVDSAVGAIIKYYDMATNEIVAQANSSKGNGYYFVSLPAMKKYLVVIDMKGYLYYQDMLDLTNPDLYKKKESIDLRMAREQENVKAVKKQLDECNARLQKMIDSKSDKVKEGFEDYQKLVRDYKVAVENLDQAVMRAKLEWLGQEDGDKDLERNYSILRIKVGAKFELKNIFFDIGKATLRKESMVELDKLVDIMGRSDIVIELGGHTDDVGKDEDNVKLSQERVASVKAYLVSKSVADTRIAAVGYGEAQPISDNKTEDGKQKNRRVEVKITEIRPREGSTLLTNADSIKKENAKFDILLALQMAALKGGVPKGSACSNEITYIDNSKTKKKDYNIKDFDYSKFNNNDFRNKYKNDKYDNSPFTKDDYIHGKQTLSVGTFKLDGSKMLIGAGFNQTEFAKDMVTDLYVNVYMLGDATNKWMLHGGKTYTATIDKPLALLLGIDGYLFHMNKPMVGGKEVKDGAKLAVCIPLGLKYIKKLKSGIIVAPELTRNMSLYTAKQVKNYDDLGRFAHWKIGANARMKNFEGGLFFNGGKTVNGLCLRAGFNF